MCCSIFCSMPSLCAILLPLVLGRAVQANKHHPNLTFGWWLGTLSLGPGKQTQSHMDLARLGKMPKQGAIAPVGPGLTQPGWPGPCRLPTSRQTNTPIMSVTVVQDPLRSCAAWLLQRLQCGPSHPLSSHPLQSTAHFTVHSRAPPLLSCTCASTWFPHSLLCSRMHDGLPSSLLWYF
jgi:hypothetical protein